MDFYCGWINTMSLNERTIYFVLPYPQWFASQNKRNILNLLLFKKNLWTFLIFLKFQPGLYIDKGHNIKVENI